MDPNTAIKITDLSKQYRLGVVGTGTLSHDLKRWWTMNIQGKEDPYLKVGEVNERASKGESEYVWALKDIDLEIEKGDVVGIIGKNGAGKSTLLKLLSRVTKPTTGTIQYRGRIASLLEVGTGFHPEMTGRENIYMNGAIMGMTRLEINRKLDEIIAFAGVERYIDTPVKRYSSGMTVRLGFAVAAHLEPDILVVDEVLAVGDAEFQKKAIGKMQDVSQQGGRSVLFVSHNMNAVQALCNKGILLINGVCSKTGQIDSIVSEYLNTHFELTSSRLWYNINSAPGDNVVRLKSLRAIDDECNTQSIFDVTKPIGIEIRYEVIKHGCVFTHGLNLFDQKGINVFNSHDVVSNKTIRKLPREKGIYTATMWIPPNLLPDGLFSIGIALLRQTPFYIHVHERNALTINIVDFMRGDSARGDYKGSFPGVIRPLLDWKVVSEN